jgi:uncharacterized protein (DUF1800 family)
MSFDSAIAANRFGYGMKFSGKPPENPKAYLLNQLNAYNPRPAALSSQPSRAAIADAFREFQSAAQASRQARKTEPKTNAPKPVDAGQAMQRKERLAIRNIYADAANARLQIAVNSDTPFAERLVHFWSNHFAISVQKVPVIGLAGDYEFSAIRPNIMGKFSDLLFAATRHPAMLVYLDQAISIGPNSPLALQIAQRRNKEFGLNENLAREILELHTLGVRTGYGQSDVTEFARALTGWTAPGFMNGIIQKRFENLGPAGDTIFVNAIHEPSKRMIMGRSYAGQGAGEGAAQSDAILSDLAVHPATARHIAAKLAAHFVSDTPPETLVKKLEANFLKTGGDLPSLYRVLVEAPEAWNSASDPAAAKFKSPWDWTVSALRAIGQPDLPGGMRILPLMDQMGQPVWTPGSPAGFADSSASWAGSAALMRRVEVTARLAQRSAGQIDARKLAPHILMAALSSLTSEGISRAESPAQALSLLLVSPEFLRR